MSLAKSHEEGGFVLNITPPLLPVITGITDAKRPTVHLMASSRLYILVAGLKIRGKSVKINLILEIFSFLK